MEWRYARAIRSRVLAYVFALATVAVATVLRRGMDPILGEHHAFTLYFAAVALTAWYGGFAPALFATIVSYFAADWFFITPRFEINLPHANLDEFMALMGFLFSCLAIAVTSQKMRAALESSRRKQAELEREVAERKLAQEALGRAQAALRRHAEDLGEKVRERTANLEETVHSLEGVCYHLAHDLRAPLRAMHGFTTVLKKEYAAALDADGKRYLDNVQDAATRMDLLIHGLLDYGRLGHEVFPLRRVEAGKILEHVLARLDQELEEKGAQIERGSQLPAVEANGALLEIVFSQLLSNALKFTRPDCRPEIRIVSEVAQEAGLIRFIVEDRGVGIPQEHLSRAFWIFERLHSRDGYPGTGIGLALASKAVERMGGRIGVESVPDQGSRFWFELRLAAERVQPRGKEEWQSAIVA
jgi:K+-sensing histidine kinase KdpD